MRTYVCDWCNRPKKNGARWILGFAAERVSRAGVHREISIEPAWSEKRAEHPLAVHFCSEAHKDFYVAALFRNHRSASPLSDSARPTSRRVRHSETSTAMGAVSIETDFQTEQLPPIQPTTTARRVRNSPGKRTNFSTADSIRSHGLSVRIHGDTATRQEPSEDIDC